MLMQFLGNLKVITKIYVVETDVKFTSRIRVLLQLQEIEIILDEMAQSFGRNITFKSCLILNEWLLSESSASDLVTLQRRFSK